MNTDVLSGVVLLVIAGLYYWLAGSIPDSTLSDEVGATGLPYALTYALAALGLLLVVRSLQAVRRARPVVVEEVEGEEDAEKDARLPRAVGFLLFGAAYVLLIPYVGYIVGIALLIAAITLYEGAAWRWTVPAAAIGGAVLYWAIFVKLLGVSQPAGTLFQGLFS